MATQLKKATKQAKLFVLYFIGFVVLVLICNAIVQRSGNNGGNNDPDDTNYPPVKNIFGVLERPSVAGMLLKQQTNPVFSKDKLEFPVFPDRVYVYKLKKERENLSDADLGRTIARNLELDLNSEKEINYVLYWTSSDQNRQFGFDKVHKVYSYLNKKIAYTPTIDIRTSDITKYSQLITSFTSKFNLLNEQNRNGLISVEFLNLSNSEYVKCTDICSIIRAKFDKNILAIKPTNTKLESTSSDVLNILSLKGIVTMITNTRATKIEDLISFETKQYTYEDNFGIYYIITPSEAYNRMQQGNGILYYLEDENLNITDFRVSVNKTKIIYLEPEELIENTWANYLQPFWYFEGNAKTSSGTDTKFIYLVPAIK
jgi:hypothetical protein